jgi:hypothetical protein
MDDNWVTVFASSQSYLSHLVKQMLNDNEIDAVVLDKQDSLYKFGDIEVLVRNADVMKAKVLIQQFQES